MRRRFFFGIAAVIGAAAACFPSFSGLDDGTGNGLPLEDAQTPPGDDDGSIDPILEDSGAFDVIVPDGDAALPNALSCADAKKRGMMADGLVLIDPDGLGPILPFNVWCKGIETTTPKEYLELFNTTSPTAPNAETNGSNVSSFAMGTASTYTCSCPPDEVRAFTKVRLHVSIPFYIATSDTSFSTTNRPGDTYNACEMAATTGKCNALDHPQSNFGVGSSCVEPPQTAAGRANVDLRNTPFHIASNEQGMAYGVGKFGSVNYLTDTKGLRKQAEVHGWGDCGGYSAGSGGGTNNVDALLVEQDPM